MNKKKTKSHHRLQYSNSIMFQVITWSSEEKFMIRHLKTISIRTYKLIWEKWRRYLKQIYSCDRHLVNSNWFTFKMIIVKILTTRFRIHRTTWNRTATRNQTTRTLMSSMNVSHVHLSYDKFIKHVLEIDCFFVD